MATVSLDGSGVLGGHQGIRRQKGVTACPLCFNSLAKDYRDLGFDVEVGHYTVYPNRLQQEGRLMFKSDAFDCTYHDSCYMNPKGIFSHEMY